MSYEKFYPNGWQSGETGGTPITPEALNHIENGVRQTYSDFAPAGYGLGGDPAEHTISSTAALNALYANCFFVFTGGVNDPVQSSGHTINYGYGHMEVYTDGRAKQTLNPTSPSGLACTLVRYMLDGIWGEWEWENPPMVLGVEYRTTERHEGRAVYAKMIDFGRLPYEGNKVVGIGVLPNHIISIAGFGYNEYDVAASGFPLFYSNTLAAAFFVNNSGGLVVEVFKDMTGYTAKFLIRYVLE